MNKFLETAQGLKKSLDTPIKKLAALSRNLILGLGLFTTANVTAASLDNINNTNQREAQNSYNKILNSCNLDKDVSECKDPVLSTLLKIDNSFVRSANIDINEVSNFQSTGNIVKFGEYMFEVAKLEKGFGLKSLNGEYSGKILFVPSLELTKEIIKANVNLQEERRAKAEDNRDNINLALN